MLALSVMLVSCDKDDNENGNNNLDPRSTREIRLKATVSQSVEKSASPVYGPINSNFTVDFPIGIYAHNGAWLNGATANVINNDPSTVSGASGHAIFFENGPYYWPSNGSDLTFFAYAPYATETTSAGTGTSPKVTHSINGQQDVMWATGTGHKIGSQPEVAPVLNFQHKLTQLQFTVKSGMGYPSAGNKVVSILVKGQPNTLVMDVATGAITSSGSADMQALSTAAQASGIEITNAGTNANSPIITVPASGSSAYTIDVIVQPAVGTNTVAYTGIPVNVTTAVGSSHMITLTFTNKSHY